MVLNCDSCVICQQDTEEPLKCPLKNPRTSSDKADAYKSFLSNVEQFRALDAVPAELYFGNEENVETFVTHSASSPSWHKSCHLKFNNSKLAKAKKKRDHTPNDEQKWPRNRKALDVQRCFFCEKGREEDVLHEVSTFNADKNIRHMITELNDTLLMARLVGGDLIAIEAKYHLTCLVKLRNRYRSHTCKAGQTPEDVDERMNESRAFVELTTYIHKSVDSGTLLFRLNEIHNLYTNCLEELGIQK